jgi:3-dehydroquinate synthase
MRPGARPVFTMTHARRAEYPVYFSPDLFKPPFTVLAEFVAGRRALLVTTPTVHELHAPSLNAFCETFQADRLVLSVDEESKTHATAERICRRALELGLDRRSVLVAVGGGVCTDLTSYAASLIRRGIACVRVPTTVIGQVDAGIGAKSAVNFEGRKSYLGSFTPPRAVMIDPTFLRTLPLSHFVLGLAEIIKIALVADARLFQLAEAHWPDLVCDSFDQPVRKASRIIELSAVRMLEQLRSNLFETRTYRRLVDAGHTFSPQIETASGFRVPHGAAVAIDLCLSATLAALAGILSWTDRDRTLELVSNVGLPLWSEFLTEQGCERALLEAARHRGGQTNLVLPDKIGSAVFVDAFRDLPTGLIAAALQQLKADASRAPPFERRAVQEPGEMLEEVACERRVQGHGATVLHGNST